jgi:hypothetical protein
MDVNGTSLIPGEPDGLKNRKGTGAADDLVEAQESRLEF